jgi:hypothetical protein
MNVASLVTAIRMMRRAGSARVRASRHDHSLPLPRLRAAHYHDEGIQEH